MTTYTWARNCVCGFEQGLFPRLRDTGTLIQGVAVFGHWIIRFDSASRSPRSQTFSPHCSEMDLTAMAVMTGSPRRPLHNFLTSLAKSCLPRSLHFQDANHAHRTCNAHQHSILPVCTAKLGPRPVEHPGSLSEISEAILLHISHHRKTL